MAFAENSEPGRNPNMVIKIRSFTHFGLLLAKSTMANSGRVENSNKQRAIFSKQGKVPAHTYVQSGVNPGSQLTHQNITGPDDLSAKTLYATPLSSTVSSVS